MSEAITMSSFLISYLLAKRSVGYGVAAVIWFGAFYGIVRANSFDVVTYFMFDASVVAVYLARAEAMLLYSRRTEMVRNWTIAVFIWPICYLGLGFFFDHHPLIQLVGLRAAIWFVPFMLLGAQMRAVDLRVLAVAMGFLNLITLAFAIAEFYYGIEMFYPRNAATELIYRTHDVAGSSFRIPATFANSATFGGYLAASAPLLVARLGTRGTALGEKVLMTLGLLAALLGVFMCGSRSPVVILFALMLASGYVMRKRVEVIIIIAIIITVAIYQVLQDERLQRVSTLADAEVTVNRVQGGANLGVIDVISRHPFGVGLGGAFGTSIPSFLAAYAPVPVGAENEFARIALEQSLIGLLVWLGFVFAIVRQRLREGSDLTSMMLLAYVVMGWATCMIGAGLLVSIPQTAIFLTYMGYVGISRKSELPLSQANRGAARRARATFGVPNNRFPTRAGV